MQRIAAAVYLDFDERCEKLVALFMRGGVFREEFLGKNSCSFQALQE